MEYRYAGKDWKLEKALYLSTKALDELQDIARQLQSLDIDQSKKDFTILYKIKSKIKPLSSTIQGIEDELYRLFAWGEVK